MGYRIKEVRESIGMSQTKLAERSGVSRGIIWALESDPKAVTTTKTLQKIAVALGTTVDKIFFPNPVQ
jgi:transcriptional regulator with XRE-family HTH domain